MREDRGGGAASGQGVGGATEEGREDPTGGHGDGLKMVVEDGI